MTTLPSASTDVEAPANLPDLSDTMKVIDFLREVFDDCIDYASTYGEPGYSLDTDRLTPLVVLGNYWCRCHEGTDRDDPHPLHDKLEMHYPGVTELLEEQGVQFEWEDEWITVADEDAVYRVEPDSYAWLPSAVLNDEWCDWMTPKTDDADWIEWASNNHERALFSHVLDKDLDDHGFTKWDGYASGWYGREDKPADAVAKIRKWHPDAEIVFLIDGTGQFQTNFSAWWRSDTEGDDE